MSNYEQLSKSIINCKGLIQKLYNRKQQRTGTLVAHKFNDEHFSIGYSLCNPNDRFDRYRSLQIAFDRALKDVQYNYPHSIKNDVEKFIDRAERYYKVCYEG